MQFFLIYALVFNMCRSFCLNLFFICPSFSGLEDDISCLWHFRCIMLISYRVNDDFTQYVSYVKYFTVFVYVRAYRCLTHNFAVVLLQNVIDPSPV